MQNSPARLMLGMVYVLLIFLLAIAIWFRGTTVSTVILVFVMLIILAEAVYVLYVRRNKTLCSLCQKWMCLGGEGEGEGGAHSIKRERTVMVR